MGEDKLVAPLQESLNVAVRTGAAKPTEFANVIVDTTLQPKAVALPTDAKLTHRACVRLVRLGKKHSVRLRQTYVGVGKFALMKHQRSTHAKQFKRALRSLRQLRTYLGRIIGGVGPKISADARLKTVFATEVMRARQVRQQQQRQRGHKIYSLHAPEVECIAKGKTHRPYEFGVKVSVGTPLKHSKGGQFVAHSKRCPVTPTTATHSRPWSRRWSSRSDNVQPNPRRCRLSRPSCAASISLQGIYRRRGSGA